MEGLIVPPKRFKVITVREDLYDELRKAYETRTHNKRVKPSFSAWLSELIWEFLQKEQTQEHRR